MLSKFLYKSIRFIWLKVKYTGTLYQCPDCGVRLRSFKAHGLENNVISEWEIVGAMRQDSAKCPFCDTNERTRLVYVYLRQEGGVKATDHVLHIAPEYLIQKFFLNEASVQHYFPGDKFDQGYSYGHCFYLDATDLPFRNNYFDWIICNHVLEHIPDLQSALKELWRVLKPGGRAILQVPISFKLEQTLQRADTDTPEKREQWYGQHDHVRLFGKDYPEILKSYGFQVNVIDAAPAYTSQYPEYKLNAGEKIFLVEKCAE